MNTAPYEAESHNLRVCVFAKERMQVGVRFVSLLDAGACLRCSLSQWALDLSWVLTLATSLARGSHRRVAQAGVGLACLHPLEELGPSLISRTKSQEQTGLAHHRGRCWR